MNFDRRNDSVTSDENLKRLICIGNVRTNACAKFRCAALRIKKALGIFRELITTTTTTRVAFWDPPPGSKNAQKCVWRPGSAQTRWEAYHTLRPLTTGINGKKSSERGGKEWKGREMEG